MALINCYECAREISDKATACPHCGAPLLKETHQNPILAAPVAVLPKKKSTGLAAALAFFFGPLGLLYSSPGGAIVTGLVSIPVGLATGGFGLIAVWFVCMIIAILRVDSYNLDVSAQIEAMKPKPVVTPVNPPASPIVEDSKSDRKFWVFIGMVIFTMAVILLAAFSRR